MGAVHTHAQSDITGLAAALAAKADGAATTSALALKAPLASPAFTGNPTAPTPSPGDNDTSIATTGFVKAAIDVVLGGVSSAFDTLSELATAIAAKADAAATTAALAGKQASNAILTSISGLTIGAGDIIVVSAVHVPSALRLRGELDRADGWRFWRGEGSYQMSSLGIPG